MSHYDYEMSKELEKADFPFYALIMAALRKADSDNLDKLRAAFPETWAELYKRYHSPGGVLESDRGERKIMFGQLTWTCHICKKTKPDELIGVYSHPVVIADVEATENIRYCLDDPQCAEAAKKFSFFKKGESGST